jgi:hypothetical protein
MVGTGRVARFLLVRDTQTGKTYQINTKCTKWSLNFSNVLKNMPNGH